MSIHSSSTCVDPLKLFYSDSRIINARTYDYPCLFRGQKSKVKVTRPTNDKTVNTQYLPNGKAYELQLGKQTEHVES